MLENHPYSSQVFLPFNPTGFLVLVAPIGDKPKIDLIEIFKVSGGDGINFNPKVWHFPLISLENEKYITIDKKDADNNIEIYNFEKSDTSILFKHFSDAEEECSSLLKDKANTLSIPAYHQCIKASHVFNLLDARGVISVSERQSYILRVRNMARSSCLAWMDNLNE